MIVDKCMGAIRVCQTRDGTRVAVASVKQLLARVASEGFEIIELLLGEICASGSMQGLQSWFVKRTHVDCSSLNATPRQIDPYPERYFPGHGHLHKMRNLEGTEQTHRLDQQSQARATSSRCLLSKLVGRS